MSREPNDDEALAFFTNDQLINELVKRFDTAVFVGDTKGQPGIGETKFAVWDRNKDIIRGIGLTEYAKFRVMRRMDDCSQDFNFSDID